MVPDVHIPQSKVRYPLLDHALADLQAILRAFGCARVHERWADPLDNVPILMSIEQVPGLIVGSGICYGFTIDSGAGEVLAELTTGRTPATGTPSVA